MSTEDLLAMCKRRGFLYPSFEIYGGTAGFYDYGPLGAVIKNNIEQLWRRYYLAHDNFAEISCPALTPEAVLKASGHADRFTDYIAICSRCKSTYRADHLLKGVVEDPSKLDLEGIRRAFEERDIKCEKCGQRLTEVSTFNLMFGTTIGESSKAYLRPETAQGIFINFPNAYRYFREKLPFGVIQLGRGYRNEISPRQGVIRMREFNMAEVEFFYDENRCRELSNVWDEELNLLTNTDERVRISVRETLDRGLVKNEYMLYFIALTKRFLTEVGIDESRLRFRQHAEEERAHYAIDCWDAEALLDDWVEIVGIADRGTYDLTAHMNGSKEDLSVERRKKGLKPKMEVLTERFGERTDRLAENMSAMEFDEDADLDSINVDGVEIGKECFDIEIRKRGRFIPNVVEPSCGIDRILYSLLYQSFRKEEDYAVLALSPRVAPIKFGVFPLMRSREMRDLAKKTYRALKDEGMECYYDEAGSIGKRYARMDEIGTPFCITVDQDSLSDGTATIRFRDTKEQERIEIERLVSRARELLQLQRGSE
jgi:glycyl-tRNA synthetase